MMDIGGIASAVDGFYRGRDEEVARQRSQEDRDWQMQQRRRQQEQQQREDQLRRDIADVPTTRTIAGQAQDDGAGNIVNAESQTRTVANPVHAQLRQVAEAHKKAGDWGKYLETIGKADMEQMQEASRRVAQLESASAGKSTAEVAQMAREIIDNDPYPQRVRAFRDDGAGGVVAELENTSNGQVVTQTYKTPADIINGLKAIYNPGGYATLQMERQKAAIKAAETMNDPSKRFMRVGSNIFDAKSGSYLPAPVPPGHEFVGMNANGDPEYRRMAPAGGAAGATGAGKGGKGPTGNVAQDAMVLLESILKTSEDKVSTEVNGMARENVGRLAVQNPGAPAEMVARVAIALAKDPSKAEPAIDPETGRIDLVVDDGPNGKLKVNTGIADAVNIANVQQIVAKKLAAANGGKEVDAQTVAKKTRETLVGMTKNMLESFPPERRTQFLLAASDRNERRRLNESLRRQAEQVISEAIQGKTPEQATAIRQQVEAALASRQKAIDSVVDLVFNYGEKPADSTQRRLPEVSGLAAAASYKPSPNSPAGRAAAVREKSRVDAEQRRQQEQAKRAALSTEFRRDAQTMPPLDLVRKYDSMRDQLPTTDAASLKQIEQKL